MRIGIDARELLDTPTGVGRYLASLIAEWARLPDEADHRFILYFPAGHAVAQDCLEQVLGNRRVAFEQRRMPGSAGTWWEQTRLPAAANADRLDVFFAPAYSAPLTLRMPLVLTLPDVSFFARPEWFRWREGARRRWLARLAARQAALIVTISEFSRREIAEHLGIPSHRIEVTLLGANDPTSSSAASDQPLVLFVGSVFTRRNLPVLIDAFRWVVATIPEARLAIVGANRTHPFDDLSRIARDTGVGDRILITDWLPEDELATYYARARAFVFLSEYEGFGLPPLEALAAGVPSVVLDTPVAREIYGDAALFVDLKDTRRIAEAIVTILRAGPARAAVLAAAPTVLARYSWSRAAHDTLTALERAARGSP